MQHVDRGLAKKTELASSGMAGDEFADLYRVQVSRPGDAVDLVFGGGRADMRVQSAAGRGDEVDGNRRDVPRIDVA